MHDVLAHRLSLVATHAGALEYRPDASPEQLARAAGVVRAGVVLSNPLAPTPPATRSMGTGLVGLTERVEIAGGELATAQTASREFVVTARLPWPE